MARLGIPTVDDEFLSMGDRQMASMETPTFDATFALVGNRRAYTCRVSGKGVSGTRPVLLSCLPEHTIKHRALAALFVQTHMCQNQENGFVGQNIWGRLLGRKISEHDFKRKHPAKHIPRNASGWDLGDPREIF